ncbi:MAG: SDR family NAD(P)-dependent oxidoreductase [Nocardioidaceae bacterium]
MTERGVAVVTGAAGGIGTAVASDLRRVGWTVAGVDLSAPSDVDHAYALDVTDADAIDEMVADLEHHVGPVTAVVSGAGHYRSLPVSEVSTHEWDRMLRVHVGGFVNLSRAVLPRMAAHGSGAIVAIASELAIGGGDADSHYSAAKGALIGLVRSLAEEVASTGVRVNAVAPGPTDTPMLAVDSPWRLPAYLATLPARRLAEPEEVATIVRFLIEEGSFCVGEVISPNSGAVI